MKSLFELVNKTKCLFNASGLRNYALVARSVPSSAYHGEKTAILCPGQGAQYVGMLQNLEPHIEEPLRRITSEILGYDLTKICWNGPKEVLDR